MGNNTITYKLKIKALSLLVLIHAFIRVIAILFIILYSFGKHNNYVTIIVVGVVLSFVIFQRCIHVDLFEFIRNNDDNLPEHTKDNYYIALFRKILNSDNKHSDDLTSLRLDILDNIDPYVECNTKKEMNELLNIKIHYIVFNMIFAVLLLVKFNLKQFLPLLLVWFFTIFKV